MTERYFEPVAKEKNRKMAAKQQRPKQPQSQPDTSSPVKHPLVGRGLHKDENGCVQNQAKILAIIASNSTVGDLTLI